MIFLRWAWRLAELGHEIHVVSDRFSGRPEELEGMVGHDIRMLERLTRVRGVRRLRFGGAISRMAASAQIDLVHGHYLLPYGYWGAIARTHPLVVSPWGTDILVDGQEAGQNLRRAQRAIQAADFLVINSEASERACLAMGADESRIERIVWYADLDRFGAEHRDPTFRTGLGWPEEALIVLSLRNFRPDTNIDVVVRAFDRILLREPRARLVLAAQAGPLRPQIEALVDELALQPFVAFVSALEPDLPRLVASADLLVAMTSSDSTPSSLLEAMASRLPAVCGQAASLEEWLEPDEGGILVPPGDAEALAQAALALLADPERRRRFGEHNERVVRSRVSPPGPALEGVYRRLLDSQ